MSDMTENLLWVEKYRPKKLSDYICNRQTLKDIKHWINSYKDNNAKPFLVLHGRPGVGKTTLAHIIFSEYGYDTIEYNASDNRTKKTIYETIGTIGKFSVSMLEEGKGKQQVGLIMDEVDGLAGGINGGVEELVSIVCTVPSKRQRGRPQGSLNNTKKGKASSNQLDDGITTTTSKSKTSSTLTEPQQHKSTFPVICTCNSIKDKKLASLLKEALVIKINQPKVVDLLNIGKRIALAEHLVVSDDELTRIINLGKKDYRAFIYNLFQWSLNPNYNIKKDAGDNGGDDGGDVGDEDSGSENASEIDIQDLEISETPLGKIGHFINYKRYELQDILRFIEADSNVYFLGIYANWLTLLKDVGFFELKPQPNFNVILDIMKALSEADIIHHQLYETQMWDCEIYKNLLGSVKIVALIRSFNKGNTMFYLQHHSKFNQMASETATLARKFELLGEPNSFLGSTIHSSQSLYYAYPLLNKKIMVKKEYEDVEKIYKTVNRYLH
jgi:DNA polymerase III delta prime subunit